MDEDRLWPYLDSGIFVTETKLLNLVNDAFSE